MTMRSRRKCIKYLLLLTINAKNYQILNGFEWETMKKGDPEALLPSARGKLSKEERILHIFVPIYNERSNLLFYFIIETSEMAAAPLVSK